MSYTVSAVAWKTSRQTSVLVPQYLTQHVQWTSSTCMACTSLLLSSRAADAVEVPNDAAPRWRPRIMRPSFLYCSIGSQKRSRTPWTGQRDKDEQQLDYSSHNCVKDDGEEKTCSMNSHSWTTECMGPTPPRMPGSWFFLMSVSHSVTAYWITLSTPSRLERSAEKQLRQPATTSFKKKKTQTAAHVVFRWQKWISGS